MIPNGKIRKAYISALPNYKVYDISVPNDETPPNLHITVSDAVLNEHENYKNGYEWLVTSSINIWNVNEKGFVSSISLEEVASEVIKADLNIEGFQLQHREMFDCKQFAPLETDTNTIERITIIMKHWVTYEG